MTNPRDLVRQMLDALDIWKHGAPEVQADAITAQVGAVEGAVQHVGATQFLGFNQGLGQMFAEC